MFSKLDLQQAENLINLLKLLKENPKIYVGSNNLTENVHFFLEALETLHRHLTGIDSTDYIKIARKRGWEFSPKGLIPELREKGLSEKEIINELIDISMDRYKALYEFE